VNPLNTLKTLPAVLAALTFAGCSLFSSPKPPTVDGTNRQSVNDDLTQELLGLRAKLAEKENAVVRQSSTSVSALATNLRCEVNPSATFVYRFPFSSTRLRPGATELKELLVLAQGAASIEVRGRTDGSRKTPGDESVAKGRALAARTLLIEHGVAPHKISMNHVSGGDYAADNSTRSGQAQNRRVEIEIFPSNPVPAQVQQ
jgi:outer membrane protein OmpA-like peptidoglycan-associated protein